MSGTINNLSKEQEQAFSSLKQKLPSIPDEGIRKHASSCNDQMLLRFLRARRFSVDDAYNMLIEALKFRLSFQDMGVAAVTPSTVENEINSGKSFFFSTDKHGRPVCVYKVRKHIPSKTDVLEGQRFLIFMIEFGTTLLRYPTETVTLLFDMTDASSKNMDMKSMKYMIRTLQNYYPESLGRVLVFNSTWFVHGIWKVVKPMLDSNTAAKVSFVDRKSICEYISEENLLVDYGGKCSYDYTPAAFGLSDSNQLAAAGASC